MSSLKTGLSITGLLVFGTTTSLFAKIGETVSCPGVSLLCLCWCDPDQLHRYPPQSPRVRCLTLACETATNMPCSWQVTHTPLCSLRVARSRQAWTHAILHKALGDDHCHVLGHELLPAMGILGRTQAQEASKGGLAGCQQWCQRTPAVWRELGEQALSDTDAL